MKNTGLPFQGGESVIGSNRGLKKSYCCAIEVQAANERLFSLASKQINNFNLHTKSRPIHVI